jgi:hypothetical protein
MRFLRSVALKSAAALLRFLVAPCVETKQAEAPAKSAGTPTRPNPPGDMLGNVKVKAQIKKPPRE